jgi:hypothetical protein
MPAGVSRHRGIGDGESPAEVVAGEEEAAANALTPAALLRMALPQTTMFVMMGCAVVPPATPSL